MAGSQAGSQGGKVSCSSYTKVSLVVFRLTAFCCLLRYLDLQKQSQHTYRPVTIKQLLDVQQAHPDAPFKIDDVDLDHVCFLAV